MLLASLVLLLAAVWQACALVFLAVRSALHPTMNPEWEAQLSEAEREVRLNGRRGAEPHRD